MEQTTIYNSIPRPLLVEGGYSFDQVSEIIRKPVSAKTPSWWFIAFMGAVSVLSVYGFTVGYLVFEGVGFGG